VPLINRLVALGLVERVTTDRDKRKRLLVVTDQGRPSIEQVKTVADDLREEILTAITPQEQEQTQRVLEKLLREVEKK
jgi:MarR family transcriptional regulator for hemolysin